MSRPGLTTYPPLTLPIGGRTPNAVCVLDPWHGYDLSFGSASSGAVAWPTAKKVIYMPVRVKYTLVAVKFLVAQGGTGTGNFDAGIYDRLGNRLINTGSTAKVASITDKVVDITDTALRGPGIFYLAMTCDNTTDTWNASVPAAPLLASIGVLTETTGTFGLPATAAWAVDSASTFAPTCGFVVDPTIT